MDTVPAREPLGLLAVHLPMRALSTLACLAAILLVPTSALRADDIGSSAASSVVAPEDDPLAVGETARLSSVVVAREDELVGEALPVIRGPGLEAAAGVRELARSTHVELVAGLALVRTELEYQSSARNAAEVLARLPVPEGAIPFALRVCDEGGSCREGALDESEARVSAYDARLVARGPLVPGQAPIATLEQGGAGTLVLRAAPLPPARIDAAGASRPGRLRVEIGYASVLPIHGGVARWTLPPRGLDARVAGETIRVGARDLVVPEARGRELLPTDELERGATDPLTITARVPRTWTSRVEAWSTPCEARSCVLVRASSARPEVAPRDLILALDVSPSTLAYARGLLPTTALSVLRAMPAGTRVRVVAFAAEAEALVPEWTDARSIDLPLLERALTLELGSSTRFESVLALVPPRERSRVAIAWIGDGGITSSAGARRAFEEARANGLTSRVVAVGGRANAPALEEFAALFTAPIVDVSSEALEATRGRADALDERLAGLFAAERPRRWSARSIGVTDEPWLLAGGSSLLVGRARIGAALDVSGTRVRVTRAEGDLALAVQAWARGAHRLVAAEPTPDTMACSGEETVLHGSSVAARVTALPNRFALVERRTCQAPPSAASSEEPARRAAFSQASLLRELRLRVMPRARDCFRRDRRGRAAYSTRLRVILTLADREIADVRVEGVVAPELAACVAAAADGLEVPPFEGAVIARWPLYTQPELALPTIELRPDVASAIDALFSEEDAEEGLDPVAPREGAR